MGNQEQQKSFWQKETITYYENEVVYSKLNENLYILELMKSC